MFRNRPLRLLQATIPNRGQTISFLHCLASVYTLQPEGLQFELIIQMWKKTTFPKGSSESNTELEKTPTREVVVCKGFCRPPGGEDLFSEHNISNYYRASMAFRN